MKNSIGLMATALAFLGAVAPTADGQPDSPRAKPVTLNQPHDSGRTTTQPSEPSNRNDADIQRLRELARAAPLPASRPATSRAELSGVAAIRHDAAEMMLLVQSD